ncbi:MAG: hypothetical protein U1C60_09370 [Rhodocyclaceae bacterium]|nr:hypothetical protein [Rhodocyclaceae bacterium]
MSTDSAATATTAAHGGDDDGDPDEVDAAQTGQAIDTLAQLWELVGCRMVPTGKLTTAPAPATAPQAERLNVSSVVMPAPAPPTCRKAERLSDGRAAIQRVNDRPARKPTPKPLLVVVRDDGRTVDRSDVQDLPAWG